jgi:hypothetical protein
MDSTPQTTEPQGAQTRRRLLAAGAAGAAGAGLLSAAPAGAQVLPPDDRYVWRERMPINVKDRGATGNGTTDDSLAIQSAIDAVEAVGGGTVYFPPGDYVVNSGLTVEADKPVRLLGAGMAMKSGSSGGAHTRLKRTTGTAPIPPIIKVSGTSFSTRGWVSIEDMGIHGGGFAGRGIVLYRCQNVYLHRLRVSNCGHNAIHCTQLFNSSGDNLFIHTSGNGTTDPAWLFDAVAEPQGACNTCLFTNVQFEGNFGTDLRLDGDAAGGTSASTIHFVNVKMEGGSGAYPYIDLGYAGQCSFSDIYIMNYSRSVVPIQVNHPHGGDAPNQFSNTQLFFSTGGSAPYALQIARSQIQLSNFSVTGSGGSPSVAAVRVDSSAANTDLVWDRLLGGNMPTDKVISDARTGGGVPQVASAATVTLPANCGFVNITGTTNVSTIRAAPAGTRVTLYFGAALTVDDGTGNLNLAGNFNTTNGDTLTLISNGSSWHEIGRSVN